MVWKRSVSLWHCQAWAAIVSPFLWAPARGARCQFFAWVWQEYIALAAERSPSDSRRERRNCRWLSAGPGNRVPQGCLLKDPVSLCWCPPSLGQTSWAQGPVQPCRFPSRLPERRNPSPPESARKHTPSHTVAHPRFPLPCSSLSLRHRRAHALWAWRRKPGVSAWRPGFSN